MPSDTYQTFIKRVHDIHLATSIEGLLEWDQETYMPSKAAGQRARQLAFIAGVGHERMIDPAIGDLLGKLEREADSDPAVATNVREMRRAYDRKVKLPTSLVQEIASATALAKNAWIKARKESDFPQFAPHLEKLLDLKRQVADKIGFTTEPYDALMDDYEPYMQAATVQQIFDQVKAALVPLVAAIKAARRQPNTKLLERHCPQAAQEAFCKRVTAAMGFDYEAGRLDVTAHPFCSGYAPEDVRLTTRYNEHYLATALFGTIHEAGHGLYEQGFQSEHAFTPMAASVSLGIHESQSRMWENVVGRSRAFWEYWLPALKETFPSLADVSLDDWYFAVNAVRPSLIRVEADEVTYGLHIMLRFDLERQMIRGQLAVRDVPAAWNAGMQQFLGVTPRSDAEGCLQDIHWAMGIFGYFPTYALGNLYAAQFYAQARQALPDLEGQIRRGELLPLREWLRTNIHAHGKRYRATELVKVVTGQELNPQPFIEYLRGKYGPLYGV